MTTKTKLIFTKIYINRLTIKLEKKTRINIQKKRKYLINENL